MCDKGGYTSSDKERLAAPQPDQQNHQHPCTGSASLCGALHTQEVTKGYLTVRIISLLVSTFDALNADSVSQHGLTLLVQGQQHTQNVVHKTYC